jgi:hypothetical protein
MKLRRIGAPFVPIVPTVPCRFNSMHDVVGSGRSSQLVTIVRLRSWQRVIEFRRGRDLRGSQEFDRLKQRMRADARGQMFRPVCFKGQQFKTGLQVAGQLAASDPGSDRCGN